MTTFETAHYEQIRHGCQRSADVIVPLLYERYEPRSVVDVGCGEGWFGGRFAAYGCDVVGIDFARPEVSAIDDFIEVDLAEKFPAIGERDLILCLETAEHLPALRGPKLVKWLTGLAGGATGVVVFSAAIPDQRGLGHINERWGSYWAGLFASEGYRADLSVRNLIWNDDRVEPWYRQNLIVFVYAGGLPAVPRNIDVVHPVIYGWRVKEGKR